MKRAVYIFWALTLIAFFTLVALAFDEVPYKFLDQFGLSGVEGNPQALSMFFSVWAVPVVSVNIYPPLIGYLLRGKPDNRLRAPNRDFWLARPDGRERIISAIQTAVTGMMSIANLLLILVYAMCWIYARTGSPKIDLVWIGAIGVAAAAFGIGYPFYALSRDRAPEEELVS